MIICRKCGTICRNEQRFCAKCGEKLQKIKYICPRCGKELEKDDHICASCGAIIVRTPNKTTASEIIDDIGKVLYIKNWIVCKCESIQKSGRILISDKKIIFVENMFRNKPFIIIPMENVLSVWKNNKEESKFYIREVSGKEYTFDVGSFNLLDIDNILKIINQYKSQTIQKYS